LVDLLKDLTLIIPFKNENEYVKTVLKTVYDYLNKKNIDFEVIAVDDSTDGTWEILQSLKGKYKNFRAVQGWKPPGYGKALRKGFQLAKGRIVVPFNGDLCDSLDDVMKYMKIIDKEGYDMAFGSRYIKGGYAKNYPKIKKVFSLFANYAILILLGVRCNDITQSFKAFKRTVLQDVKPKSNGYEISMEIALKAIKKGYKYKTIPISWIGRKSGVSKMKLRKNIPIYFRTFMRILLKME